MQFVKVFIATKGVSNMKWSKLEFWYSCYISEDLENDRVFVIAKVSSNHRWTIGVYDDSNIDYQPHSSREGYIGCSTHLSLAKKRAEKAGGE